MSDESLVTVRIFRHSKHGTIKPETTIERRAHRVRQYREPEGTVDLPLVRTERLFVSYNNHEYMLRAPDGAGIYTLYLPLEDE